MKKRIFQTLCVTFFVSLFTFTPGCSTTSRPQGSGQQRGDAPYREGQTKNPTEVPIDWQKLMKENPSPAVRAFLKSAWQLEKSLNDKGIPYAATGMTVEWNQEYFQVRQYPNQPQPAFDFMRLTGIDCTRLIWHLFVGDLKLPYGKELGVTKPKHQAVVVSETFARRRSEILTNFLPLPASKQGGFRPRTGDVLAFPGHALMVLDPQRCVAVQSVSWVCTTRNAQGGCQSAKKSDEAGVTFYELAPRDCNAGVWRTLDAPKNRFTAAWRHRAFAIWIEQIPKSPVEPHQTIEIAGRRLGGRWIYFPGNAKPAQASRPLRKVVSPISGAELDVVRVIVPTHVQEGPLRVYWGDPKKKPTREQTNASVGRIFVQ